MIAVIGLPGSQHHRWERFTRSQCGSTHAARQCAEKWLEGAEERLLDYHPAAWPQPLEILSERDALQVRWRDGFRVYE